MPGAVCGSIRVSETGKAINMMEKKVGGVVRKSRKNDYKTILKNP
jgi:hypothetical protein